MPIEIKVPRLGWTMEEGIFVGWLKQDGDAVRAGEPLFTLDGDKALQEIEATDSGTLRVPPDAPKPGSTVRVGDLLGYLVVAEEHLISTNPPPTLPQRAETPPAPPQTSHLPTPVPAQRAVSSEHLTIRRAITPRALRTAHQLGVDWKNLVGTGRGGRIRERDVLAAAAGAARST